MVDEKRGMLVLGKRPPGVRDASEKPDSNTVGSNAAFQVVPAAVA